MRQKGRKAPHVRPGERRQYEPGQLIKSLDPAVRQNIEQLAAAGYEHDGRGLLIVEISDQERTGIASAQYYGMTQIAEMNRRIPFAEVQPLSEAIEHYDPEHEFVALVLDATSTRPNPQTWFDVFPRET